MQKIQNLIEETKTGLFKLIEIIDIRDSVRYTGGIHINPRKYNEGVSHMTFLATIQKTLHVVKIRKGHSKGKEWYQHDLRIRRIAQSYARKFNEHDPPIKIYYTSVFIIHFQKPFKGNTYALIEKFIGSNYEKYNNNCGWISGDDEGVECPTAQAFSHFTFMESKKNLLIVDIQGCEKWNSFICSDPEIHSAHQDVSYGYGDLGWKGINAFFNSHVCNEICHIFKKQQTRKISTIVFE